MMSVLSQYMSNYIEVKCVTRYRPQQTADVLCLLFYSVRCPSAVYCAVCWFAVDWLNHWIEFELIDAYIVFMSRYSHLYIEILSYSNSSLTSFIFIHLPMVSSSYCSKMVMKCDGSEWQIDETESVYKVLGASISFRGFNQSKQKWWETIK